MSAVGACCAYAAMLSVRIRARLVICITHRATFLGSSDYYTGITPSDVALGWTQRRKVAEQVENEMSRVGGYCGKCRTSWNGWHDREVRGDCTVVRVQSGHRTDLRCVLQ